MAKTGRKRPPSRRRQVGDGGVVVHSGGQVGLLEGPALVLQIDARSIVDRLRRVVLAGLRQQILDGKRPDGGPQRPLSKARADEPGRTSDIRGVRTQHFADDLQAGPIKGTATAAASTISAPTDRNAFLGAEKKRGVRYMGIGPALRVALREELHAIVAEQLAGRVVEVEQGQPTAREEA